MQRTDPAPMQRSDPRAAAGGYWQRRGLPTEPGQVAVAPSAPLLLLALLGASGGEVLLPKPSAAWYAPQARMLGRTRHLVPVTAESGGVPDPFALLETVRRVRDNGGDPRVLLLSVADDPTGTAPPPELLHEVCEVAVDQELLIISDETWRDTFHDPHHTVIVSPAEILPEPAPVPVVVVSGLGAALLPPPALHLAVARFPDTEQGRALGTAVHGILDALHTDLPGPALEAAVEALTEPASVRRHRAAAARTHGVLAAALCRVVSEAGGLCRPPRVGRHLYADLEPLRPQLASRGIDGSAALEAELVRRLGPYAAGGHRFGDDPHALRVRLGTELLVPGVPPPLESGGPAPAMPADPLKWPGVAQALRSVRTALTELSAEPGLPPETPYRPS